MEPDGPEHSTPTRYLQLRGVLDVIVSTAVLVLASPVLLLAAALIKLTTPGPLFFTQKRIGKGQAHFRIYKLRTMRAGRKPDPEELVPLDHPEITPIGRILRRTKIDELPQLLNILKGEMALIGPRPTLPEQVAEYNDFQRQRLGCRPGITGLAQINGNTVLSWNERIKYDVYYVKHASPWLDLVILVGTARTLLFGEHRGCRPFDDSPYARRTGS